MFALMMLCRRLTHGSSGAEIGRGYSSSGLLLTMTLGMKIKRILKDNGAYCPSENFVKYFGGRSPPKRTSPTSHKSMASPYDVSREIKRAHKRTLAYGKGLSMYHLLSSYNNFVLL